MHAMRRQGRDDSATRMGWIADAGAYVAGEELADCANMGAAGLCSEHVRA